MTVVLCPVCTGDGTTVREVPRPQSFSRDIGEIDMISSTCYACDGRGEVLIGSNYLDIDE
tara:strand:+ start:161 stop:340 length:180 start_codon:yes stop_codon:yes gene_type:complete